MTRELHKDDIKFHYITLFFCRRSSLNVKKKHVINVIIGLLVHYITI